MTTKHKEWHERVMSAHVPTYFKENLIEASTQKLVVGFDGSRTVTYRYSFFDPGYHLGIHIHEYVEEEPLEQLESILDEFLDCFSLEEAQEMLDDDEKEQLFWKLHKWLEAHMRGFYGLVPRRRQSNFLKGFCEGVVRNR
jgi:hypothetical protein